MEERKYNTWKMVFEVLGAFSGIVKSFNAEEIGGFMESISEFFSTLNSYLPENRVLRLAIYGSGVVCLSTLSPYILRHTEWFDYYYRHMSYFHRYCPFIDEQKAEIFKDMRDSIEDMPKYRDKFIVVEIQCGGGSNLMYYPEETRLIAVDHDEKYKDQMLRNFPEESEEGIVDKVVLERFVCSHPSQLIGVPDCTVSAIVSIHSLCYPIDLDRCFDEFNRVLMPGGRVYFIEHTKEDNLFTLENLQQVRFIFVFALIRCHVRRDIENYFRNANFSRVQLKRFTLDLKHVSTRPLRVLAPHVYGYAVK